MILRRAITALALVVSAVQAEQHQILFNKPPPTGGTHTLTLQRAVHISTHRDHLDKPALYRHFSSQDRLQLELLQDSHSTTQSLASVPVKAWRPNSNEAYQAARHASFNHKRATIKGNQLTRDQLQVSELASTLEWDEQDIVMPNVSDVSTLASLAKMTANAYSIPDKDWFDLDGKWNVTESFGWLEDGIRGHVFADETNSTIVIAIKGTSAAIVGGNSPTGKNDKTNDNLFFSCCCARVDWSWSTVCDCYNGTYSCRQDCIEEAVMLDSAYYPIATNLYNNITALYPNSQIWLAGHSLGGSIAALLSLTFGVPSVSFEAPGELLPARRLHLPLPPNKSYSDSIITTHVYHNADPIAMGVCNGAASTCSIAGFAMESKCHSGRSIIYDTVGRLGWSVDVRTHTIRNVIAYLFVEDWGVKKLSGSSSFSSDPQKKKKRRRWWWPGGGGKKEDPEEPPIDDGQHEGRGVPESNTEDECVDCFKWSFPEPGEELGLRRNGIMAAGGLY
ncbi:alpha/beta-hydrolase [Meredithblackwellia eburnea MCA 4105]